MSDPWLMVVTLALVAIGEWFAGLDKKPFPPGVFPGILAVGLLFIIFIGWLADHIRWVG